MNGFSLGLNDDDVQISDFHAAPPATSGSARRFAVVAALVLGTAVVLALGATLLDEPADDTVYLPSGNAAAAAAARMAESFPDSAGLSVVSVLFRGDVTSAAGLVAIEAATAEAVADPLVADRLALENPVATPSGIVARAAGVESVAQLDDQTVSQIIARITADPTSQAAQTWASLVAPEPVDGVGLAVASITLRELGDADALADAELRIADLLDGPAGPLEASVLSPATITDEKNRASSDSMSVMIALSLLVIASALLLFFRSGTDLSLSLVSLGVVVIGAIGFQGWAGPRGMGLIGQPNQLTNLVPIMLISLCVDYSIKAVESYRDHRHRGLGVVAAAGAGTRAIRAPLAFAGSVTVVSLLTNVASPIPANQDFGIVAAFGVVWGLIVFLTLPTACRVLLDHRREARAVLAPARPLSGAIPGADRAVGALGDSVAKRPMVYLSVLFLITLGLGVAITQLSTEFSRTDFLPSDGASVTDIDALDTAFGGRNEVVSVLVRAELTDDRTARNLLGLNAAFDDPNTRPQGATSGLTLSAGALLEDWSTDSGEAGDHYDEQLADQLDAIVAAAVPAPEQIQAVLDRLEVLTPEDFAQVLVDNADGEDLALLQFSAATGDQDRSKQMIRDLEGLWYGDRQDEMTGVSGEVISVEITQAITDSSTQGFASSTIIALLILVLVYGITRFHPVLGAIAVVPIVLVLIWVLGTMALVGIPYNVVTSLIAALSMGIGIDYSIHVIEKYTEAHEEMPDISAAMRHALRAGGSAVIGSGLTTALGFGVLIFNPLTPYKQFGIVTVLTIGYAVITALVAVPPLLTVWASYHEWRQRTAASTGDTESTPPPDQLQLEGH